MEPVDPAEITRLLQACRMSGWADASGHSSGQTRYIYGWSTWPAPTAGPGVFLRGICQHDAKDTSRPGARGSAKRGGSAQPINLDDAPEVASPSRDREIMALDDALYLLAEIDARKARVIELRFFGGLISEISVNKPWSSMRKCAHRRTA
jgi:hypothetical protein